MPQQIAESSLQLELSEWGEGEVIVPPPFDDLLRDAEGANGVGAIQATLLHGGRLRVRTTSWVGRLQLGSVRLVVQPKINSEVLLDLARYGLGLRQLRLFGELPHTVSSLGFEELLVLQLVVEIEDIVSRGLHRAYVRRASELGSPRGRIDLERLASSGGVVRETLPCRYHERDADNLLNRVLLGGLGLGRSLTQASEVTTRLDRVVHAFDQVQRIRLDPAVVSAAQRAVTRLTESYSASLTIVRLLVESQRTSLSGPAGTTLRGFLFDMNRLFQAILGRFLRENLVDATLLEEKSLADVLSWQSGFNPNARRALRIRPDFAVVRRGQPTRILDAKYRDLNALGPTPEMTYQLALYAAANDGTHEATMLYPSLADVPEQRIRVRTSDGRGDAMYAVVSLRGVNLLTLARLVRAQRGAPEALRYCQGLVFPH